MRCAILLFASPLFTIAESSAICQTTTRINLAWNGAQGDSQSYAPSVSADGRYVVFVSDATNLIAGDTNGASDVFLFDRVAGTLSLVSVNSSGTTGNGQSEGAIISSNGNRVVFTSDATDLVPGVGGAGTVYVRDLAAGTTTVASIDDTGAPQGACWSPVISGDGLSVAFWTGLPLVDDDHNQNADVYVRDLVAGTTSRVSVGLAGLDSDGSSYTGSMSFDGRLVAFSSSSDNLVPNDSNSNDDVFLFDRQSSTTSLVSSDSNGVQGDGRSDQPDISDDGTSVGFVTNASSLGATPAATYVVVVKNLADGSTSIASVDGSGKAGFSGAPPSMSADGRFVVLTSPDALVADDTNGYDDVYVRDRSLSQTFRESIASDWTQGDGSSDSYGSSDGSSVVSSDGSVIAFYSRSTNLCSNDTNGTWDIFVRERCVAPANWSNYGAGFPGTHGVPTITARANPVIGSDVTVDLANSWGRLTAALLFIGFDSTDIPSSFGGHLLVAPIIVTSLVVPSGGISLDGTIPVDERLCGLLLYLQAWEGDPGAARGVSFTPGLEMVLGF